MKRVVLIDSHAIIHRAYHALPPLTAASGEPVSAVYGFAGFLLRVLKELRPDYIAAAFDMPGKTFRHEQYEKYKAHRPPTPDDLKSQFSKVHELVESFGIPLFRKGGFEADDIIGTMVKKLTKEKDVEMIVVTGDMDALQLVGPHVKVYTMRKGITDTAIYDEAAVRARYGFDPEQIIDYKGLKGDPSDNIKGVRGIGEKTAVDLIQKFGSVKGIYEALAKGSPDISPSVAAKLKAGKEDAEMSRELATMELNAPIEFTLKDLAWDETAHLEDIAASFQKYGFVSLLKRLADEQEANHKKRKKKGAENGPAAPSLFEAGLENNGKVNVMIIDSPEKFREFQNSAASGAVGLLYDGMQLLFVSEGEDAICTADPGIFSQTPVKKFFTENDRFIVHDAKSIIRFLGTYDIELGGFGYDVMLAAYVTGEPVRNFSYQAIASRIIGSFTDNPRVVLPQIFTIAAELKERVMSAEAGKILTDIEMPLSRILAGLEDRGILLDVKFLQELAGRVNKEIERVQKEIYGHAGGEFNINSSQQLPHILFDVLKLRTLGLRKTEKGGVISTRESELEKLKNTHPIIECVLMHRELMKLKTTYIDVLPELLDPRDQRIHTTFNQTGAATGRLSSVNPNLQNIPAGSGFGREVRRAFIAAPGFSLVSFDYSQIELRVAAHIAHDEKMIRAFQDGKDIHRATASQVYHISPEEVTSEQRRAAKTLNFGVLYGMGSQAFAEGAGLGRDEAREFIDEYFKNFSGIRAYIENTKAFALEHGYVETMFGRRRSIPEIHSANWQLRREAERMAVNHPIQGTATGDIIKLAMIQVDDWIRRKEKADEIRMLLQVHDELVFEIAECAIRRGTHSIKEIMEEVVKLAVPLVVDVKIGPNWDEQRPMRWGA